jgi:integrase
MTPRLSKYRLKVSDRVRLLAACKASPDRRLFPLIALVLGTAARQSEPLGLHWSTIDFASSQATVYPKYGKPCIIGLDGQATEALRELAGAATLDSGLIFAGDRGSATFPRRAWARALREAGLVDFRFHDLRHTAVTSRSL